MNLRSRNEELAQTNKLLINQIEDKEKNIAGLQNKNRHLSLEKIRQQKIANKLVLQNKVSVSKLVDLKKTKNLYAFISQVNQNILRVKDEHKLFKNACNIAIKFGGFKIAWIGLFNNTNRVIDCIEQIGIPFEDIDLFKNIPLRKNGAHEFLLKTGGHIIINDILTDPQFEPWKSILDKKEISSYMTLPIKRLGEIIGTFNLYASELNYFKKEEIALLSEVTGDISFALDIFEKDKKRQFAENQVIANEKRYRLLIEKSTDIKLLINVNLEIVYGSPSMKAALGYGKEQLLNLRVSQITHPDYQTAFKTFMDDVAKHPGKSFKFQQRFLHLDGSWVWCGGIVTNMLDEPGLNGFVANFRNISEKKMIEQEREFDKNNLDALINNTNDLMWSLDKKYNLITSNIAFDQMIKSMTGQIIGKGKSVLSTGFPTELLKKYQASYNRVFAGETFNETVYTPLPAEFWSNISYSPIRKNNEVIGAACHAQDITDIKLAERKLSQSESRLKEAQSIAHMGNFEIDLVTQAEVWSDEMYNLYGVQKESVVPSTALFYSFVHPEDLEFVKDNMKRLYESFLGNSIEFRFYRNDGELRYACSEAKLEFDENKKMTRFFGVMQDITDRKLAEKENLKMINDIMRRNNDLEQFGYIISHNLRAPVANIIGASNALNDDDLTIQDKELLNKGINVSIMKLDNVVQDLNQILQVKGSVNETKEIVVFSTLVEDIKESIADFIKDMNVKITYDFSASDRFLTVKPYLHSIFYNLISNSIKYRRPQIDCLIEIKSLRGLNSVKILFKDNGTGIDLSKVGHQVFGLYKRFHPMIEGKGIGLFMVKTQVETLGGKIGITSDIDNGTEFMIEFVATD